MATVRSQKAVLKTKLKIVQCGTAEVVLLSDEAPTTSSRMPRYFSHSKAPREQPSMMTGKS